MRYKEIRLEEYRYDLPQDRIAIYPLENRHESKLLVFRDNMLSEKRFIDLPGLLPAGSLIIWNNTKVIPARLEFRKQTGAAIEIFLMEPVIPSGYTGMFNQTGSCCWKVIVGNQKKWKKGPLIRDIETASGPVTLAADYYGGENINQVMLTWSPGNLPFSHILDVFGKTPIPPYLKRDSTAVDKSRYQTVYAHFDGSVAAPTAGLHFTPELIGILKERNIRFDSVTLHVGSGTFIPVKSETVGDHQMHGELVMIGKPTIRNLLATPADKQTVVGTTSMRSLESLFWLGNKLLGQPHADPGNLSVDQWDPYKETLPVSVHESLHAILGFLEENGLDQIQFTTSLIILPGYQFRMVNRLITNFHQPSSTLLLLVSAFIGDKWRDVYHYALTHDFRFLSYGDSSLLDINPISHD